MRGKPAPYRRTKTAFPVSDLNGRSPSLEEDCSGKSKTCRASGGTAVSLTTLFLGADRPSQTLQRLARRKFHQVSIRIAHHCEVPDNAPDIDWRLDQNVLLPSQLSYSINLLARITLKPKVIQTSLYFILHNYQHEQRIFTGKSGRAEPDVVPPLEPAIANDRKTTE